MGGQLVQNSQFSRRATLNRIKSAFGVSTASSTSEAFQPPETQTTYGLADKFEAEPLQNTYWIQAIGGWREQSATTRSEATSSALGGVVAGFDLPVFENWRVGLMGGYARSHTRIDALASKSSTDSYIFGAYAGTEISGFGLRFGGDYTWHNIDASRIDSVLGQSSTYSSNYNAKTAQIYAEASYQAHFGSVGLEPFANIAYVHQQTDDSVETGGLAPLTSPSNSSAATFFTFGIRSEIQVQKNINLFGSIGWQHAFGDLDQTSNFSLGGNGNLQVSGASIVEDEAIFEAGLGISFNPNVSLNLSYRGQFASGIREHGAKAQLIARF